MILNKNFYKQEIIEEAIADYKEHADIKIINQDFNIEITEKSNEKNIKKEFANYILGLMNNELHDK